METAINNFTFSFEADLIDLQRYNDDRGSLLPIEFEHLPFVPKRLFTVSGMLAETVRGEHAHHSGQQFLICLHGSIDILLRNESDEAKITLVPNGPGLLLGPNIWSRQTYRTDQSVLLVLTSEPYDTDSYLQGWSNLNGK